MVENVPYECKSTVKSTFRPKGEQQSWVFGGVCVSVGVCHWKQEKPLSCSMCLMRKIINIASVLRNFPLSRDDDSQLPWESKSVCFGNNLLFWGNCWRRSSYTISDAGVQFLVEYGESRTISGTVRLKMAFRFFWRDTTRVNSCSNSHEILA